MLIKDMLKLVKCFHALVHSSVAGLFLAGNCLQLAITTQTRWLNFELLMSSVSIDIIFVTYHSYMA